MSQGLDDAGYRHIIIGGQAVIRHGHVRTTNDVDLTVYASPFDAEDVYDILNGLGLKSKWPNAVEFMKQNAMLSCEDDETGFGFDLSFLDSPYIAQALERALWVETDGYDVPYLGVEDVVIHKALANRDARDQRDAMELIARNPDLNQDYIRYWLAQYEEVLDKPLIELVEDWYEQATGH